MIPIERGLEFNWSKCHPLCHSCGLRVIKELREKKFYGSGLPAEKAVPSCWRRLAMLNVPINIKCVQSGERNTALKNVIVYKSWILNNKLVSPSTPWEGRPVQNALLLKKQEVFHLLHLLRRALTLGLSFGVSGDAVMWLALPASDLTEINERCVPIDSLAPLKRHRSASSQQPAKPPLFTVEAMDQEHAEQTDIITAQRWTVCFQKTVLVKLNQSMST